MFGISAPRVAVRTAVPWYWRAIGVVALFVVVMLFSRSAYDFGKKFAGFDQGEADRELQRLTGANAKLEEEVARLGGGLAQAERQLQMERATYDDLVKQMKAMNEENATLKEDLAFFQTLMPSGGKDGAVAVNRFLVQNDALPGEYRYRLLLTQTGQRTKDFQGRLQLVVNLQQDGRKSVLTLPAADDPEAKRFMLNFRFYQRVEGSFRVAPGATVKGVQLRVFEGEGKEPRVTQAATLS